MNKFRHISIYDMEKLEEMEQRIGLKNPADDELEAMAIDIRKLSWEECPRTPHIRKPSWCDITAFPCPVDKCEGLCRVRYIVAESQSHNNINASGVCDVCDKTFRLYARQPDYSVLLELLSYNGESYDVLYKGETWDPLDSYRQCVGCGSVAFRPKTAMPNLKWTKEFYYEDSPRLYGGRTQVKVQGHSRCVFRHPEHQKVYEYQRRCFLQQERNNFATQYDCYCKRMQKRGMPAESREKFAKRKGKFHLLIDPVLPPEPSPSAANDLPNPLM